ncbi:MAG: SpoIIE family protein phosphatase, partial [Victivallales bacterium]|nr:SpoIIE family protein phosphatase [Victivallales bacterium]
MKRRILLLLAAAFLYAVMLALTWTVASRRAHRKTEAMLDNAMVDLESTINDSLGTMLAYVASSIVDELGEAKPLSLEQARAIAVQRDLDEFNVINRNGRIIGSSDASLFGYSMYESMKTAEFMSLCNGRRQAISQPFRTSVVDRDAYRKYVGVAFPGGEGIVQVGMDERRATQMFPSIMEFILEEWLIGETGFFLCASILDGRLISTPAGHRREAFYLPQTGYDQTMKSVVEDGKTTFRQVLFGQVCHCRAIIFARHRIVAAVPLEEFFSARTNYTVLMAIVLAIVMGIFVVLLWRIDVARAKLQAFYKAEDEKRAAELELGKTIQKSALPSESMTSEYCAFTASMQTAREVGGDFYDFFSLDDNHIAFLVADVSGKGITGALYMMTAKTLIKDTMLASPEAHPSEVLSRVNEELCRNNPAEMFLTAWVGVLDLNSGRVSFANAGHNPPLVKRSSGETEWVKPRSGCPLACFDNVKYKPLEMALAPGDAIFLYTDGVTEA